MASCGYNRVVLEWVSWEKKKTLFFIPWQNHASCPPSFLLWSSAKVTMASWGYWVVFWKLLQSHNGQLVTDPEDHDGDSGLIKHYATRLRGEPGFQCFIIMLLSHSRPRMVTRVTDHYAIYILPPLETTTTSWERPTTIRSWRLQHLITTIRS
jgi:hypothetical protein